jgi:hypothetical protein
MESEEKAEALSPEALLDQLQGAMPDPEEIMRQAQIEQHNAEIQAKREAKLEARRLRRDKQPRRKDRRRK